MKKSLKILFGIKLLNVCVPPPGHVAVTDAPRNTTPGTWVQYTKLYMQNVQKNFHFQILPESELRQNSVI